MNRGKEAMKGFIVKQRWMKYILSQKKIWDVRNGATKIRGKIYLIQSGTKSIVGECELIDCIKLDSKIFDENRDKHCIHKNFKDISYKNPHAWVLDKKSIKKYQTPVPYAHQSGAIIWVNLEGKCDKSSLDRQ